MINCDLLVKKAYEGRANAYTPYSNFKVGAAVLTEDDTIYTGCNIENASYGATNCVERTAFFQGGQRGRTGIYSHCHCRRNIRRGTGGICVSMRYLQTGDAGILQG